MRLAEKPTMLISSDGPLGSRQRELAIQRLHGAIASAVKQVVQCAKYLEMCQLEKMEQLATAVGGAPSRAESSIPERLDAFSHPDAQLLESLSASVASLLQRQLEATSDAFTNPSALSRCAFGC